MEALHFHKLFTVLSFNIFSFTANFQAFLDQCLHGRNDYITSLLRLPGYNLNTQSRSTESGGVALYFSKDFSSSKLADFSLVEADTECCCGCLFLFISRSTTEGKLA